MVELRGRLNKPQIWDPHTGSIVAAQSVTYGRRVDGETTRVRLKVDALSGQFVVGAQAK